MEQSEEIKPLACWKGTEFFDGCPRTTATVILRTAGCSWGRCLMCGYRNERHNAGGDQESFIRAQLAWIRNNVSLEGISIVKWFTSGSFFDDNEVPPSVRKEIAQWCRGRQVIAETRPEYVFPEHILPFLEGVDDGSCEKPLYVAMGLETSNDTIRNRSIKKGFSYGDYTRASDTAHSLGAGVKAYLLMKPPYLTERDAIDDMVATIRELGNVPEIISMNPCTVQQGCDLEWLWKRKEYRPPYLWSVLSVLLSADRFIACDPVGGGSVRGPHNCGRCDREIVQALRDYYRDGDRGRLEQAAEISCTCREEWNFVLEREHPLWMPLTR